jgi:uncharacterized protein
MNRTYGLALLLATLSACTAQSKVVSAQTPQAQVSKAPQSADVVRQFFAAFGSGDLEGVVGRFAPNATIVAVRSGPRREGEVYGTYAGREGVRQFVANLGHAFDTKAFNVDLIASEGETAFAKGSFSHVVKRNGATFASDWALLCRVHAGQITEYRFFEDSAALVAADPTVAKPASTD